MVAQAKASTNEYMNCRQATEHLVAIIKAQMRAEDKADEDRKGDEEGDERRRRAATTTRTTRPTAGDR